ncbi:MAG: hypothetical protein Q7S52_02660 [bacterium]|nr:hypothetical protein [bacterium]
MKHIIIVSAFIFSVAPLAYAAINVGDTAGVEVKTTVVTTQVNTKTTVGVTATTTPMMMNVEGGMEMDGKMMEDGEEHERAMERAEMMADDEAAFGLETAKMHINVSALMKEENEPGHGVGDAEVDTAAKVHSSADFEHFVAHKAKSDSDIKEVDIKDGKVKVHYRMPAKFLGFIKGSVNARAEADATGKIEVDYPWYHMFMKKHVSSASLQSEIARAIAAKRMALKAGIPVATIEAQVEAAFDAPNLFEMIVDALHGASLKVKAEAEGTVQ